MQPGIVAGIEAGLAEHGLRLHLAAIADQHSRANCATVRLDALQFHLDPLLLSGQVISQQRWGLVQIDHKNVQVSVVIEISEGAAPAAMGFGDTRASLFHQFFEGPIAEVPKYSARCLVRVLWQLALDLRVNVTRDHEQIGIAVVIEVDNSGSPTDVARFYPDAGGTGDVVEIAFSVIVVKAVGVVGEVGLKEIQMPVQIIVTDSQACLLYTSPSPRDS